MSGTCKVNLEKLKGKKFGRLRVTGACRFDRKIYCRVVCKCGKNSLAPVRYDSLTSKKTRSCGCLLKETTHKTFFKHGLSFSKEHNAWANMLARCRRKKCPQYETYGAKGIRVCRRWKSFNNFIKDMGRIPSSIKRLTLDRIDNKKGYNPKNCRWASFRQQVLNRTVTKWITFNGETLCLSDWARKLKINRSRLSCRLYYGWPIELAFTLPKHVRYKKFQAQEAELGNKDV